MLFLAKHYTGNIKEFLPFHGVLSGRVVVKTCELNKWT